MQEQIPIHSTSKGLVVGADTIGVSRSWLPKQTVARSQTTPLGGVGGTPVDCVAGCGGLQLMTVGTEVPTTSEGDDNGKATKTSPIRTPSVVSESATAEAPMELACDQGHNEDSNDGLRGTEEGCSNSLRPRSGGAS
jgi:hypothetical protein